MTLVDPSAILCESMIKNTGDDRSLSNTVIPLTIITTISSPLSENLFLSFTIFLFIPLFIPLHDILIAEVYIYAHLQL